MSPWFLYGEPNSAASVRLFCFPYAGGGSSIYRPWWQCSDEQMDVVPVQLPGRENRIRDRPEPDLLRLVAQVADVLSEHTTQPYALFGHSMGSLIAYELAHQLAQPPVRLLVSGSPAPQLLPVTASTGPKSRDEVVAELRRLNGTPSAVLDDEQMLAMLLPRLRADWQATDGYRYRERSPLNVPISAFGGTSDPDVSIKDLLGWQAMTECHVRTRLLPGDHFFIEKHVRVVHDLVRADLAGSTLAVNC